MTSASADGRDDPGGSDRQLLIDLVPVPVLVMGPDGDATWVNRAWTELTGQTVAGGRGEGWLDLFDATDRSARREELLTAARSGARHGMEWTVSADGHGRRTLQVQARPHIDSGEVVRIVVTATDVTDDRARSASLLEQATHDSLTGLCNRSQFLEFLTHALDRKQRSAEHVTAVLFVDVDGLKATNDELGHAEGDRVLCDVAARILSGVRPADVVARYGGDEFTVLCEDLGSGTEAEAIADRIRSLTAGDPRRAVSIGVAIARGSDADPASLVAEADQAMYEARRGNGHRQPGTRPTARPRIGTTREPAGTSWSQTPQLETDQAVRLIAVAAHELRAPLTTISGFASTLRADRGQMSAADFASALEIIERQARRLALVLDQLLDLGRIHESPPEQASVDLAEAVTDALEAAPPPTHVSFTSTRWPPSPVHVAAERSGVTRILVNLLTNAYRYGGPNVSLDSQNGGEDVTVAVQDDGPGVPKVLADRIFDPFVRGGIGGDTSPGGSGLGLALARDIAESFGGGVTYEPVAPHGARFLLRLPAAPP